MGDRNNPIKFGPEWLRNMSRERSAARTNIQNAAAGAGTSGGSGPGPSGAAGGPSTSSASGTNANDQNRTQPSKVLLARLRYGREEMLALYDCSSEAPPELKNIDTLYQPRGKQPVALNNTFDDDLRDTLRSAPPIGSMTTGDRERFGIGRGAGRGILNDGRGRGRSPYVPRQPSAGRGLWHSSNPRVPGYSLGPDEEGASSRPWVSPNATNRNSGEQTEWTSKTYRNKRQGANTNWRQPQARDDGEEWRSSDPARNRQLDKWEWGSPPSWSSNRRNWVGGDSQNDENLPEWAAENADCGGTFDSSGAFHGYSNDDTNIPKHQDSTHPLTRSHTHGSFPRSKVIEEGSEEWWASEKAKKLSPKRFDAGDIKFKKQAGIGMGESSTNQNSNTKNNSESSAPPSTPDKNEPQSTTCESPEPSNLQDEEKYSKNSYTSQFGESKTFDALMRSNIDMEDTNDERGNFQSVIINANNSLRQKHQHLVPAVNDATKKLQNMKLTKPDMDMISHKTPEDLQDNILRSTLEDLELLSSSSGTSLLTLANAGLSSNMMPQSQKSNIQMSNSVLQNHGMNMDMHINSQGLQSMQPSHLSPNMQSDMSSNMQGSGMSSGHPNMQSSLMQSKVHSSGMPSSRMPSVGLASPRILQDPRVSSQGMQQVVGITNSALNASLGLPIGPGPNINMPMQLPQQVMPSGGNNMSGSMGASNLLGSQGPVNLPGYQNSSGMTGMSNNVGSSSLFLGQNSNPSLSSSNDMPMSNHSGQSNMFPMHGLQHSSSQASFGGNSIYSNNGPNLTEQWYYEDPDRNIQGPFSSKDMYNWYRAGFFSPSLMVRRACETMMRPLGTYGPVVPFTQRDILPSFPLSGGYDSRPQGHDSILSAQSSLGLDDSLWSQPTSSNLSWMQQSLAAEARVNNLPVFFWDQQPSAIASNSLLPEEITKEMKTEDQILAQLRATQSIGQPSIPFIGEQSVTSSASIKTNDCFAAAINATPNLEELHKLIQKDTLTGNQTAVEIENSETQQKQEKAARVEVSSSDTSVAKPIQAKAVDKVVKLVKENDKSAKNKENNITKNKSKKAKDDKKDDVEAKTKEDEVINAEKRSQEPSPSKKKDEKSNKKELEREKKEWLKEGFTIVKGAEKSTSKDNKKKAEEARAAEEVERKRKEEEKLAAEEDKKRKQAEAAKKQQEQQSQQRQPTESVAKKAPWSAVANQTLQAINKEGLTLAEIQRLEREKKLEQMKEQQQMMQIIAQQQAAALAREQEMQAGLGWAKKKANNTNNPGQSLAEIQAEARKQAIAAAAAATAAATAAAIEEAQAAPPPQTNHVPWGNTQNGGLTYGFWDPQPNQSSKPEKTQEQPKPAEPKAKKKPTLIIPPKKEMSPAVEFEAWCTTVLDSWNSKIDVPTFVGFLKDIESPYEVKDYVKCYLGDTKDSGDFARQFLERRSKLLRVGMVTPSDDLCSPAIAVTPRTASGTDFQELKSKGKKTKKNKMLKVDARILGFSVTAAEDRINVGDIDTV